MIAGLRSSLRRRLPLLLCAAVLALATGYPVLLLFLQSIFPDILGGSLAGAFDAYRRIIETPELGAMIGTSLVWAGSVTLVSWVFGIPCGYLLARTNLPGKLWARLSLLVPIMTPPYILALSYVLVMQQGGFGDALVSIPTGLRAWFFSFWGVTVVMAFASFGYVALAVEATLSTLPRRLEDAATVLGASWRLRVRYVLLPLTVPAILNSGLLVFLEALSNFGVPAVLGTRSNLPLLPAEIFYLVTSWPLDLALATSLSSLLCLLALMALYGTRWLAQWMAGGHIRPGTAALQPLSRRWIWAGWGWIGGLFLLSSVLPYCAMVLTSVAASWGGDGFPPLTLKHYVELFEPGSRSLQALITSLGLSIAAATLCVVIGGYIAYVSVRSSGPLRHVLDGLATLPRVIPKIVVAVGLILAWNAPWIPLNIYNTVWMLLLAYVVIYITDALNYANSTMRGMSPNLEHAATVLGAGRYTVFTRIVLPGLRPALMAAWLTTFIVCMRELVASVLLLPPGVDVTATYIFNQFEQGDIAAAMAMATVTIVISTIVLVGFQFRRRP